MTITTGLCIALVIISIGLILMSAWTYDVKSNGCMIVVFGLLFLVIFGIVKAFAEEVPKPPARAVCWAIRRAVQNYGEAEVTAWARARGVSEREIESGRRCLNR